ncbi:hypothetical protein BT96DRAFT_1008127 [Gymnopus androsaceus JB14]|uniref:Uncharacterized protein n=1 Tax=Gymnopus androsaceus JB14 TaxID=1447944 RepID=A0A6A4GG61_9AGAR|nr:hypothetical protein BT96DRAFT_1008127 [Gymnopus androsaceus JB14]
MLAQAVPLPSAMLTLAAVEVSGYKEFKMNKKQYKCHYSSSNASLASFNIPPDPKVGNVHKDLSSNIWWVYQQPAPDGPVPEGRVGQWQSYSGDFAFEQIPLLRPIIPAPSIKGVKKRVFVKPKNTAKRRIDVEDNSTAPKPKNTAKGRIDIEDNSTVPKPKKLYKCEAQDKRKAQEAGINSDEGEEDLSQWRHKVKGKKGVKKPLVLLKRKTDEETMAVQGWGELFHDAGIHHRALNRGKNHNDREKIGLFTPNPGIWRGLEPPPERSGKREDVQLDSCQAGMSSSMMFLTS